MRCSRCCSWRWTFEAIPGAAGAGAGEPLRDPGGARRARHGSARRRGVRHRRRLRRRQVGAAADHPRTEIGRGWGRERGKIWVVAVSLKKKKKKKRPRGPDTKKKKRAIPIAIDTTQGRER